MRRTAALIVAATFAGGVGIAAAGTVGEAAEDAGSAVKRGAEATGHYVKEGAEATGHAAKKAVGAVEHAVGIGGEPVSAAEAARYERAEQAEHRASGTVRSVNHESGMVELDTKEGMLRLPFRPVAVKDVRDGEHLTVELGYAKLPVAEHEAATGHEGDEAAEKAEHWVTGTVKNVDRTNGIVDLGTADATATVQFPPAKLADLKDGDRVAVEVAIAK